MADGPDPDARTPCPLPGVGESTDAPPRSPQPLHVDAGDAGGGLRPATLAITAGRPVATPDAPLNEPVTFASAYHAGGPVAYARDGNPSWSALEEAIGGLEGGSALVFASGMAAIAAVLDTLAIGARVVAPADGYSGTRVLLRDAGPPGRWETVFVDVTDTAAVLDAATGAALVWLESPTNPLNGIVDLPAVVQGAHDRGALVAIDNTYATPLLQRPLDHGADVVVHSVTKLMAGHSDVVLGVTVTRDDACCAALRRHRSSYGAIPGPMETYLALRGLRSLAVRVERAQANAGVLAERLAAHPAVTRVRYPGLADDPGAARAAAQMVGPGTMVAFEVQGGAAAAEAAARATRVIVHATSLGGIETTMERRARWAEEAGIPASLLRMSVGCEDVEDLWADLERALRVGMAAASPGT
ncbi:MAG: trans-sulfuration enzyme family protein [Actinomycetota bacterium]